MPLNSREDNKFTWGDSAVIKKTAPPHMHPGEYVAICGMTQIDPEDVALDPSLVEPTWRYTAEFGDGSSIEIPECYLERYEPEPR